MAVDIGFPSTSATTMRGPAYVRPEMQQMFLVYARIRDALSGEDAIKKGRTKYLPKPNPEDNSEDNRKRYQAYLERAVFYPVSERTMAGMVGQIFMRAPTYKLPSQLEAMEADASGDGQSLEQVARTMVRYCLGYGRFGALADYPNTKGEGATQLQIEDGEARPVIKVFAPWHSPNWRTYVEGSLEKLSLVIIFEAYEVEDDGFERKYETQIRELRMVDGVCQATLWEKQGRSDWTIMEGPYTYYDADGNPLDHIPFIFGGAINNNATVDAAPFDGLTHMNIAHFRNSADYEESAFLCGQPTPVFGGLTAEWVKDVLGGKVTLGSRSAVALPVGGTAALLQAAPNTLVKEAMDGKERQMVALGAKLVQQAEVQRTATETDIESTAENSVLSAVAKNVQAAMKFLLGECAAFAVPGGSDTSIDFELSTEFDLAKLDPAERAQLIKEWQSGAIAFEEMRAGLRAAGIASLPDAAAATKIAQETADAAAAAMLVAQSTGAVPPGQPPKGLPGPAKPPAKPPAKAPKAPKASA